VPIGVHFACHIKAVRREVFVIGVRLLEGHVLVGLVAEIAIQYYSEAALSAKRVAANWRHERALDTPS